VNTAMNQYKQGRRLARQANIPLSGNYYAVIDICRALKLDTIARIVGYKKTKFEAGSTTRCFFEFLK